MTIEDAVIAFTRDRRSKKLLNWLDAKGWRDGGCYALAHALKKQLPHGEYFGLGNHDECAWHMVVKISEDVYLDGAGFHTAEQLLSEFRRRNNTENAVLFPVTDDQWYFGNRFMVGDQQLQEELGALLSEKLRRVLTTPEETKPHQPNGQSIFNAELT